MYTERFRCFNAAGLLKSTHCHCHIVTQRLNASWLAVAQFHSVVCAPGQTSPAGPAHSQSLKPDVYAHVACTPSISIPDRRALNALAPVCLIPHSYLCASTANVAWKVLKTCPSACLLIHSADGLLLYK